ncbi:MAG: translation initiation factor IF-3 [Clostridia bacterium]|nr:translation initiation factor IF-3 [Clostridia bacterium]
MLAQPFLFFLEVFCISKKQLINDQIKASEVRLIDHEGNQLGIVKIDVALRIAADAGLDLVEIAPEANPVVCKILDFGKFRFDKEKRDKENRKKTPVLETKEIQLRCNIAIGDFTTKLNRAKSFLEDGKKVKVMVKFMGREIVRPERGAELLGKFIEGCGELCVVEKQPLLDGRNMITILAPPKKTAKGK